MFRKAHDAEQNNIDAGCVSHICHSGMRFRIYTVSRCLGYEDTARYLATISQGYFEKPVGRRRRRVRIMVIPHTKELAAITAIDLWEFSAPSPDHYPH